jgi:predicted nucleic acid-binding protein
MEALKVLDTDVFIDHFRGLAAATAYIQGLPVAQRATTDITLMELYQ